MSSFLISLPQFYPQLQLLLQFGMFSSRPFSRHVCSTPIHTNPCIHTYLYIIAVVIFNKTQIIVNILFHSLHSLLNNVLYNLLCLFIQIKPYFLNRYMIFCDMSIPNLLKHFPLLNFTFLQFLYIANNSFNFLYKNLDSL